MLDMQALLRIALLVGHCTPVQRSPEKERPLCSSRAECLSLRVKSVSSALWISSDVQAELAPPSLISALASISSTVESLIRVHESDRKPRIYHLIGLDCRISLMTHGTPKLTDPYDPQMAHRALPA
jgi:hypothetical protein